MYRDGIDNAIVGSLDWIIDPFARGFGVDEEEVRPVTHLWSSLTVRGRSLVTLMRKQRLGPVRRSRSTKMDGTRWRR